MCEGTGGGDGETVAAGDREDPRTVMRVQRGNLIGTRSANFIMARGHEHRTLRGLTHDPTRTHRQARPLFPLHRSGRPHMTVPERQLVDRHLREAGGQARVDGEFDNRLSLLLPNPD